MTYFIVKKKIYPLSNFHTVLVVFITDKNQDKFIQTTEQMYFYDGRGQQDTNFSVGLDKTNV